MTIVDELARLRDEARLVKQRGWQRRWRRRR
jgi:hypothetical protein